MHILLAYSTRHFQPDAASKAGRSSAAVLAGALHDILSRFGEVEYVDGLNPPRRLQRRHYDLLVSILGGISPLCRRARFDKVCLFAVNMHPVERNSILDRFNAAFHVCDARTLDKSIVSLATLDDIGRADAILLAGNETVRQSYVRHSVDPARLRCFNYASALPAAGPIMRSEKRPATANRFAYAATEMCLRKGFDIVAELFSGAARRGKNFHLTVIGGRGSKTYAAKLAALQQELGERISVEGWVPSDSERYPELLRQNDFIIFPSLEEGQAGSVLDALACGLVPIVTPQTGIDCSPLGMLEPTLHSQRNKRILDRAFEAGENEVNALKQQTAAYYAARHLPWRSELEEAFRLFLKTGRIHPEGAARNDAPCRKTAPISWARRYLAAPGAWLLRFLCPSKQKRKRLYNYCRMARLRP